MIHTFKKQIGHDYECVCDFTGEKIPYSEIEKTRDWGMVISYKAMSFIPPGMRVSGHRLWEVWQAIIKTSELNPNTIKQVWLGVWLVLKGVGMVQVENIDAVESVVLHHYAMGGYSSFMAHLFVNGKFIRTYEPENKIEWSNFDLTNFKL